MQYSLQLTTLHKCHAIHLLDQLGATIEDGRQPNPNFFTLLDQSIQRSIEDKRKRQAARQQLRATEHAVAYRSKAAKTNIKKIYDLIA